MLHPAHDVEVNKRFTGQSVFKFAAITFIGSFSVVAVDVAQPVAQANMVIVSASLDIFRSPVFIS